MIARILDVPVALLRNWRVRGCGPPFVKLGRLVRSTCRQLDAGRRRSRARRQPPNLKATLERGRTGAGAGGSHDGRRRLSQEQRRSWKQPSRAATASPDGGVAGLDGAPRPMVAVAEGRSLATIAGRLGGSSATVEQLLEGGR